jgi:hypothetical protein
MSKQRLASNLGFIFALLLLTFPVGALAGESGAASGPAPADEYFGSLHMSVLGVRNVLHDVGRHIEADPANGSRYLGMIVLTETSIRDWESKYPADSWLPRSIYGLQHLYGKLSGPECARKALDVANWLIGHYPSSEYARTMRDELETAAAKIPQS